MLAAASALVNDLRAICGGDGLIADPEQLIVYECDAYTLEKQNPSTRKRSRQASTTSTS